jgi:Protein of unknown function (DUF2948)
MDMLKLVALDADDLAVISAHMQDGVLKAGDIAFWPKEARLALIARRFDWEGHDKGENRRRLAGLQFGRVTRVQSQGLDPQAKERVLNLLSVTFAASAADAPDGDIVMTFSDGAALRLSIECIEAQLTDLGPVWEAAGAPSHPDA